MLPRLRTLAPGQHPSAEDWNRLVAALGSTIGSVTGETFGEVGMGRTGGGIQVFDLRAKGHWAKIGAHGTGAFYAHKSVAPAEDGTFTDLPEDADNPYGSTTVTPAVEINGRTDVPEDVYVWVWPNETVPGWNFEFGGAGQGADCAAINPGMATTDCLHLRVESVSGACSGVDADQLIVLAWDAGDSRWESGATDWTGTGSGGSGPAHFGFVNGVPYLTLDGVYGMPLGCADGGLIFVFGGAVLCGGSSTPCADFFTVSVTCGCCPAAGWAGPGWYCVVGDGEDCATDDVVCADYTDEVPCDGEVVICDGPFDSQEECQTDCSETPAEGGEVTCCPGRNLAATLYASLSGGEGSMTLTWDAGNSRWAGSKLLTCGETLYLRFNTACGLTYSCDGVTYISALGGFPFTCGPPFTSNTFTCNMDDTSLGCVVGSCGSITATVSE